MEPQRILLIEDERGARDAMTILLTDDGHEVCAAETGKDGLRQLRDFRPDTVVCDFLLPDMDGLEVLHRVRSSPGLDPRFIILTAACGNRGDEQAARQEADVFLRKPLNLSAFRCALEAPSTPCIERNHDGKSRRSSVHRH